MSRLVRLFKQSGSIRIAAVFVLLLLVSGGLLAVAGSRSGSAVPVDRAAYDELMATRLRSLDDLLDWFGNQQAFMQDLIPPGLDLLAQPGIPAVVVMDFQSRSWPASLLQGIQKTKPAWRNSVPTYELDLQETILGYIEIRDSQGQLLHTDPPPAGYQPPYDALVRPMQDFDSQLNRYRLRSRITLLPQEYVEPYLYAQAEIEAYAEAQATGGMRMMMGLTPEELGIAALMPTGEGLRVEITYPESYSGTTWSVYSYSSSFDGLTPVWTQLSSGLLLTGATQTGWTDLRPMDETELSFYAFGNNEVDADRDELSDAQELLFTKTDVNNSDTDGDGLKDGWESINSLNANSAAGIDGASGDPDGDGLSNAEEQAMGTNPRLENQLVMLSVSDVQIEYKSAQTTRSKCGLTEYMNPSEPQKYYLEESGSTWLQTTRPQQLLQREASYTFTKTVDIDSGWPSYCYFGYAIHTTLNDDDSITCLTLETNDCFEPGYVVGFPQATPQSSTDAYDEYWFDNEGSNYLDCSGPHDGPAYYHRSTTMTLSSEYTTANLLAYGPEDLERCGGLDALSWGMGYSNQFPSAITCQMASAIGVARRDLAADELTVSLSTVGYRFCMGSSEAGVCYAFTWFELFYPTNGNVQVLESHTAKFVGTGGAICISANSGAGGVSGDLGDFTIQPPSENGYISVSAIQVEIDVNEKWVIPAKTSWPDAPAALTDASTMDITIRTTPSGFEHLVTLAIDRVTPTTPTTADGVLTHDSSDATLWHYEAFPEAKTEKHPEIKQVYFGAKIESAACDTEHITVYPIFQHLSVAFLPIYSQDRENAWRYARWKYDVNTSSLTSISYAPDQSEDGLTGTFTDSCTLGPGVFTPYSENLCAAVLLHENVHGYQSASYIVASEAGWNLGLTHSAEVDAHNEQLSSASSLGLTSAEIGDITAWRDYYNRTGPHP